MAQDSSTYSGRAHLMKSVEILGVEVDAIGVIDLLAELRADLESGKRRHVVTVNPEMVMRARHDAAFKECINAADYRVPDGNGLLWAADYLRRPLHGPLRGIRSWVKAVALLTKFLIRPRGRVIPEVVRGSSLVSDLAGLAEEFGHTLYLLGAAPGVAERAAEVLRERFPEVHIGGAEEGSPSAESDDALRTSISQSGASIVLVAFGAPKQERWIARNLSRLSAPCVAVGVGGAFDYLTGSAPREGGAPAKNPPAMIQRRGLEWLWRLITQPWRWRRIMTAFPSFVRAVVRYEASRHRTSL